jgi:hypothetical protein
VIRDEAAREAVSTLGLLVSEAIPTIASLLDEKIQEHPRAIAAAYRKTGEQLSLGEKKLLGIRANGFLSRMAFSELSFSGLTTPLTAHETTLLRATFTLIRHRRVAEESDLRKRLGRAFVGFKHETLHHDCGSCNKLDGLVTDAFDAAVFPPMDCVKNCTASYGISPKIDFFVDVD